MGKESLLKGSAICGRCIPVKDISIKLLNKVVVVVVVVLGEISSEMEGKI